MVHGLSFFLSFFSLIFPSFLSFASFLPVILSLLSLCLSFISTRLSSFLSSLLSFHLPCLSSFPWKLGLDQWNYKRGGGLHNNASYNWSVQQCPVHPICTTLHTSYLYLNALYILSGMSHTSYLVEHMAPNLNKKRQVSINNHIHRHCAEGNKVCGKFHEESKDMKDTLEMSEVEGPIDALTTPGISWLCLKQRTTTSGRD